MPSAKSPNPNLLSELPSPPTNFPVRPVALFILVTLLRFSAKALFKPSWSLPWSWAKAKASASSSFIKP